MFVMNSKCFGKGFALQLVELVQTSQAVTVYSWVDLLTDKLLTPRDAQKNVRMQWSVLTFTIWWSHDEMLVK